MLRDQRYDAVLHLVTAADGAQEFYTLANNQVLTLRSRPNPSRLSCARSPTTICAPECSEHRETLSLPARLLR